MSELRRLCGELSLPEADIERLERVEAQLPLIAEVTNADVFIDVPVDDERALVVAQARPSQGVSAYQGDVSGAYAYRADEPAVFHAFRALMPVCDLKAVTQEGRTVRQNVAPILNESGALVAVLIREKDVSDDLQQQRKYEELARSYERSHDPLEPALCASPEMNELRETHHRVKNDLQLLSSILRLQARGVEDPALKGILEENAGRVLSIAAIHDMLTYHTGSEADVGSRMLLGKLCDQLSALIPPEQDVGIRTEGDDLALSPDTATSVATVVTELVTNAILHAFPHGRPGRITVSVLRGMLFHTVTVRDDGVGFDPQLEGQSSLGLEIVRATVRDKLGGMLRINSESWGTKVSFDFRAGGTA